MGYNTEFFGRFNTSKELTKEQIEYLIMFSESRRLKRDPTKISKQKNVNKRCLELLKILNLPIGKEGEFYCGKEDYNELNESIINYNHNPTTQPGLSCDWIPNEDGSSIIQSGMEKFYEYVEWIEYMIESFFKPWE